MVVSSVGYGSVPLYESGAIRKLVVVANVLSLTNFDLVSGFGTRLSECQVGRVMLSIEWVRI